MKNFFLWQRRKKKFKKKREFVHFNFKIPAAVNGGFSIDQSARRQKKKHCLSALSLDADCVLKS